jgi:hypothetical protein
MCAIQDTFVYIIPFTPGEWIYVAHHAVSAVFLAASLHLGKGAHACLFGMWIGESPPKDDLLRCAALLRSARPSSVRSPPRPPPRTVCAAGEVTNPVFHVYNILNALRKRRPRVQAAFRLWAPLFTALFIFTRTLAGPLVSWWWCRKVLLEVDAPLAHKACWIFVSVTIVAVSQPFSLQFWRDTQQLLAAAPPPPPRRPRRRPAKLEASIYDSARDMFAMLRDSD